MIIKIKFFVFIFFCAININAISIDCIEGSTDSYLISSPQMEQLNNLDNKFPIKKLINKSLVSSNQLFSFNNIASEYPLLSNEKEPRGEGKATFEEITNDGKWIDSFSSEDVQSLPVGIKKEISNVEYQVGFSKAYFKKDYTELTVFVRIILPQTDERGEPIELFFGANNVKLSHDGGLIGAFNLVLLGDVFIPFNAGNWLLSLKGGFNMETGVTENTTYVTIDCDGVKEFSLLGEVQFSRKLVVPIDELGNQAPETRPYTRSDNTKTTIPNRVRGNFSMVASDWNDIMVEISLSPFAMTQHPDKFQFMVNQAIFDFSDLRSPDVPFPAVYQERDLFQPSFESWRGIHVSALQISLPKEFKTKESVSQNNRVTFSAYNMIIDDYGVSGLFEAENLFSTDSGRTSKEKAWSYSLNKIGIELQANTLVAASFEGEIVLPLSKSTKIKNDNGDRLEKLGLGYIGLISEEEYLLNVSTAHALNFDIWKAKARLEENSSIEMRVDNGNFRPKAVLHGTINIAANKQTSTEVAETNVDSNSKNLVDFKGIVFQNLQLQTVSPIFQADYFGYKGKVGLANFPVSIADIGLTVNDYEASLGFDLSLNLMGEEDKGFAATTRLEIIGKFKEEEQKQKWKFDKIDLSRIDLKANIGAMELKGDLLLMNNDPEYGDGFSANLKVKFEGVTGDTEISSKAIFGKKEFRYWYVDASVSLPSAATTNLISLKGFSGGASYRMVRKGYSSRISPTGVGFTPSRSTGLGVKAMVLLAIGNDNLINGGAGFEIAFNRSGGVNRMGLYGELHLMQAFEIANPALATLNKMQETYQVDSELVNDLEPFLDKSKDKYPAVISGEAGVNAYVGIDFDFQNKALHGTLDTYINVAGGIMQGRGPGGRSGWAELHISKEDWYLYVGTPSDPQGIRLGVGPISIETGNYFMVGTKLEDSPPPPQEVADILGVDINELDYMRDENALESGGGVAFGTNFKVDTGDIRFLMLYANFIAGAGFDIMLRDYGEASCVNTGRQVGIDGWYANGQAYAYLQGELGIQVKLFFIKKKIPIIEAAAAVLLQAKAPNPIWMRGYLAGRYNLLGGLVKGDFRFKLTLGEECELQNQSPLGGIKMIADLTPKNNEDEIDVFAAPQATFNMKVNEPIIIPEDNGDKTYKVLLDKMEILDDKGQLIEGELEWSRSSDRVTLISTDILPPETNLTITCQLSFQEYVNGVYRTINVDGVKATEIETRTFKTGSAPNHIPLHNIEYCYPTVNQKFVYPKEHGEGYIQLKRGQDYLFDDSVWKSEITITDENEKEDNLSMRYNNAKNEISYNLQNLGKLETYTMAIVSKLKNSKNSEYESENSKKTIDNDSSGKWDKNVTDNSFEVTKKEANNVSKDGVVDRLSYTFNTSGYNTFSSKMRSIKITSNLFDQIHEATYLAAKIEDNEGFEIVELIGDGYSDNKPLIKVEAKLVDDYFQEDIDRIIYSIYGLDKQYTIQRDPSIYGFVPSKAIGINTSYLSSLDNENDLNWRRTRFPYRYDLALLYKLDYVDIKNEVFNDFIDGRVNNPDMTSIINNDFLTMRKGHYRVKMDYVLPGDKLNSTYEFKFYNPLNFR